MTTPRTVGQRFQVRPFGDLATDPYWITINAIGKDGSVEWADDDGMGDTVSAAEWAKDYEPRIVALEPTEVQEDAPAPEPEGFATPEEAGYEASADEQDLEEEEPEPVPGEEEYAPPAEPQPAYVARNMAQNAESLKRAGVDPRAAMPSSLERLADMVNRKFNCEAMARKFQEEAAVLTGQIWKILTDAAKAQLVPPPSPAPADEIPFGKPAADVALAQVEKIIDKQAPAPERAMSSGQARQIAEHIGMQAKQKLADDEYAKVAKLEMNRAIREVKNVSDAMAGHMATAGIKTLGQFCTVANERPNDWFASVKYVTKEKAAAIEGAIETHWRVFKAKYGR